MSYIKVSGESYFLIIFSKSKISNESILDNLFCNPSFFNLFKNVFNLNQLNPAAVYEQLENADVKRKAYNDALFISGILNSSYLKLEFFKE